MTSEKLEMIADDNHGKAIVIIDGQFGSTGKGHLACLIGRYMRANRRLLSEETPPPVFASVCGANSGHTAIDYLNDNKPLVLHHIPCGAVGYGAKEAVIYIGAGAIINPRILKEDIQKSGADPNNLYIHENAAVIEDDDILAELDMDSSEAKVASTQSGTGQALCRKIQRKGNIFREWLRENPEYLLSDPKTERITLVNNRWACGQLEGGSTILLETSQGYGLSLNSQFYPHATSRVVSVEQALSDAVIQARHLGDVIGCFRTLPIRTGNLGDASSGPCYSDQKELLPGDKNYVKEISSVTARERRMFTWSKEQFSDFYDVVEPDYFFINFVNYVSKEYLKDAVCRSMGVWYKTKAIYNWGLGLDDHSDSFHEAIRNCKDEKVKEV